MAITPENRMEQILNGESITPENRAEYFTKEAIDNAGSSGSLPEPGTAGNVLTSTGDAWESAAPSGAEPLIVKFTKIDESVTCDTAPSAIYAAYSNKALIRGEYYQGAEVPEAILQPCMIDDGFAAFSTVFNPDAGENEFFTLWVTEEGGQRDAGIIKSDIPTPEDSDDGKVLGVDDGEYALVDPSILSPLKYVHFTQTQGEGNVTTSTTETAAEIIEMLQGNVLAGSLFYGAEGTVTYGMIIVEGVTGTVAEGYTMITSFYDANLSARTYLTMTAATGADVFSVTTNG